MRDGANRRRELVPQRAGIEQGMGVPGKVVAFLFLGADVHQPDSGTFALQDMPGEDAAHHPVLEEMGGLGVDVGADVEQDTGAVQGGGLSLERWKVAEAERVP